MHDVRTVTDFEVETRRVFLRADLNVPVSDGQVTDTTRIDAIAPTVSLLRERGCRIVLASHLGRPKGREDQRFSLEQLRETIEERLGVPIRWSPKNRGEEVEELTRSLEPGEILLIENLRFDPGEESNDPELATALSKLADFYVNDAFGACHREHASIVALPKLFGPSRSAAGLLLARELEFLDRLLVVDEEERPFVAVLGGAKIKGKIEPLEALVERADHLLIGGGVANTFLAARGMEMGNSLLDDEMIELAEKLLAEHGDMISLPADLVLTDSIDEPGETRTISTSSSIPSGMLAVDIGEKTVEKYASTIHDAAMVFWNGPMGVFEREEFSRGTFEIASAIAHSPATSIVGGGESVDAVNAAGLADEISHVSTGGGAALELISGSSLPGVAVLTGESGA